MSEPGTLNSGAARFDGGLREVAPRTWAWLQPNGGLGESNAGLICGDGGALLVDTLWDERLTRRMLGAMAPQLADAPLRRAFVTHPDGDHWWGNAALPTDVEVVATDACARAMRAEAPPRTLAGIARLAGAVRRAPGRPGAVARRLHAQFAPFAWSDVRLRLPDRTVADGATLDAGGRSVRVLDLGPTHTAADAVVHVPDEGVVFAADLLFVGVTPIMWHGPVETWLTALERLLALDAGVYVPGHGPPCGRAEIEAIAAYWRWLDAAVSAQHAAGRRGVDAARALVRSPEHAAFAGWLNPERIVVNVATIERNRAGGPAELSPPARARLLVQMAALAQRLAG
ncbi:MAG TPA: MBL fold metallo-hydrolase [Conexibacter sp.]|nr:MBL fold metallo-hydrolase [Conexibacter sp.]